MDPAPVKLVAAEIPRILFSNFHRRSFRLRTLNNQLPLSLFFVIFEHTFEVVEGSPVLLLDLTLHRSVPFFDIIDKRALVHELIEPQPALLVMLPPLLQISKVLVPIFLEYSNSFVR